MSFKPIQKLSVHRTLSTGEKVAVGTLAQNRQGVFFQYHPEYLSQFGNLSPFLLPGNDQLHLADRDIHQGLHGVFADSLPDGWGLLLQDRVFRQHGILPAQVTAMDRLAFVGQQAIGALSYSPVVDFDTTGQETTDLASLGLQAQAVFDGQTDKVLAALVAAGSSGGARPKAQIYTNAADPGQSRTRSITGDDGWLIKFTSANLALGHEEGLCEAAYLDLAAQADLQPPQWKLLDAPKQSGAKAWLAVKRFDWINQGPQKTAGRLHMHSACGLLNADFRMPSLDYSDLIKASRQLCKSPATGRLIFRRAIFNLFAANQDDHSKNWAFLQDDQGRWQPAPFFDVTYSPHPFNQHATAFSGFGKAPPLKSIQKLASSAGFSNWKAAQQEILHIVDTVANFQKTAQQYEVKKSTIKLIHKTLESRRSENKVLLQ
ncbi:type II toxin-antitoxin system HipA family toxin [Pelagibaculum spongiae]|uniref:Type II toxin-antitoxin system HipA family toxin n=1 Tax=Pelagibaculum spongiae TaxID=2080658 RepID=A0A2V1GPD4_9GAMM|nr:type II toxin-antitoxin system HipA family toxin [Pelagibaculum spongiae]PVZ64497.1 type II toxin-antitoxin system HipA family toxin [Pelagibaculum spongiae]